jgi:hypothetical protein
MHIDSARELKALCLKQQVMPIMARAAAASDLGLSARAVAEVDEVQRTMALGIIPKGKNSYQIGVRVQTRALESGSQVEAIRKQAKGEVEVRYIGRIIKRAVPWYRSRQQPLLIGTSIGHFSITAGTLGCFVTNSDKKTARILSNNHVLAAENDGRDGDAILQPGSHDEGQQGRDTVGTLDRFVRLNRNGSNHVDAALATIQDGIQFEKALLKDLGQISGTADGLPADNERVQKIGRTTGLTNGLVTAFELDNVVVGYDLGNLRFDGQIEIDGTDEGPFSLGGDSGSLIFDRDLRALALLFAGGDQGGKRGKGLTYANPIQRVFEELGVRLLY